MVYSAQQSVIYGSHGVCTILQIEEKCVDRKMVQYYVLEPLLQPGTKYFVPVHNALAVGKIRLPMDHKEIRTLVENQTADMTCWIESENQRKLRYRELLGNCDPKALFCMLRVLRQHRQEQLAQGRKFHVCDANFLKDGENLLANELAFVLGIDKADALNMI